MFARFTEPFGGAPHRRNHSDQNQRDRSGQRSEWIQSEFPPPRVPSTQSTIPLTQLQPLYRSDYRLAEDIRLNRLNSKLKQSALKPRALTDKEEYDRRQAGYETDDDDNDPEQQQANEANPAQGQSQRGRAVALH